MGNRVAFLVAWVLMASLWGTAGCATMQGVGEDAGNKATEIIVAADGVVESAFDILDVVSNVIDMVEGLGAMRCSFLPCAEEAAPGD